MANGVGDEVTDRQRFAFEAFIGHIILERREVALAKGEDSVHIGDARDLMERAFRAGWEWGESVAVTPQVERSE